MKKLAMVMIALIGAVLMVGSVFAASVPEGASTSAYADQGVYDFGINGTVDVKDGHVYYTDLDTNTSSIKWAGLYGNVSGNIVLSDDDQDVLHHWPANGRIVYATSAPSLDWSSIASANEADVTSTFSHLVSPDADNYSSTFNETATFDSNLYASSITTDRALTYDAAEDDAWETFVIQDAATNIIFAGMVQEGGAENYKGETVDYQMILPEDGTNGDDTVTEYTLFAELQ